MWVDFCYRQGICVGDGLWLDPDRPQPEAIVSHAHADHVRPHDRVVATAATLDLIAARTRPARQVTAVTYGRPFVLNDLRCTLFPAGHVLGSAQVLVEDGRTRLLYSGDLRLRPGTAAETTEVPQADVLIMETTFGRPRYLFPAEEEVVGRMLAFCEASFRDGETPVFLAYSLGKAQEALALLARQGIKAAVHPSIEAMNAVYRRHGVDLPQCVTNLAGLARDAVLIWPPHARRGGALDRQRPVRTAVLTGWAMDPGARYRYQADAAIPLSDHCGYDDLLRYVELVGARTVYTVHGFQREFALDLQRRGREAYPLGVPMQLALPGIA